MGPVPQSLMWLNVARKGGDYLVWKPSALFMGLNLQLWRYIRLTGTSLHTVNGNYFHLGTMWALENPDQRGFVVSGDF